MAADYPGRLAHYKRPVSQGMSLPKTRALTLRLWVFAGSDGRR